MRMLPGLAVWLALAPGLGCEEDREDPGTASPATVDAGDAGDAVASDVSSPDARPARADADSGGAGVVDAAGTDARGDDVGPLPPDCRRDGCRGGLECDDETGECVESARGCSTNLDCFAGRVCLDEGEAGRCQDPPFQACASDDDCPPRWACDRMSGACLASGDCDVEAHCPPGTHCDPLTDRCEFCRVDADCGAERRCLQREGAERVCSELSPCEEDGDCRPGRACGDGACGPATCEGDRFEDDDTPGRAAVLSARRYPELVLCGDETEDWFRVPVGPELGLLVVLRPFAPEGASLGLALYEPVPGREPALRMAGAGGDGARWVARPPDAGPGDALVRVVGLSGGTVRYELDVRFQVDGPCVDDPADRAAGDDRPLPKPDEETEFRLCPNDSDEFLVDVAEGAGIVATAANSGAQGQIRLRIEDPGGAQIDEGGPVPEGWRSVATARVGGIHTVRVGGRPPLGGLAYRLRVRVVVGEVRRECEEADLLLPGVTPIRLGVEPGVVTASCASDEAPTRVFQLELAEERSVRIGAPGANVALREQCALADTEIACAGADAAVEIPALASGLYGVVVHGQSAGGEHAVTLELDDPPPAPENDRCEDARPIVADVALAGDTWTASDLAPAGPDGCAGVEPGGRDAFFRFTLDGVSTIAAELDAGFDGVTHLLPGCGEAAAPVACLSEEPIVVGPGEWIIVVEGRDARARGDFTLRMAMGPPPPSPVNAACAGALPLGPGGSVAGDTLQGGDSAGPDGCGPGGQSGPDLAYQLVDVGEGTLLLELDSEFDAVLHLQASCDPGAREIACRAAGRHTILRLEEPVEGAIIWVDGAGPDQLGAFTLKVTRPERVDPDCGEAEPTRPPMEWGGSTAGARGDQDPGPGCAGPFPLPGPDVALPLDVRAGDRLTAILRPDGWDAGLYLLSDCASAADSCLVGVDAGLAGEPEWLEWVAEEDGVLHLVVDSFAGAGDFRVHVSLAE